VSRYYYTVASLPMLFYDGDLPMSRSAFLEICGMELTANNHRLLESVSIDRLNRTQPACDVLKAWHMWESGLRNELAGLRAQTKGWDVEKYIREGAEAFGVTQIVREATGVSPLEGEDVLNRARWSFLDELEVGHHFDIEKLMVYFLKLQILERKASFDKEKGTEKFKELNSHGQAA
jgi:hypothetical protein